ncbi:MAG: PAS domain-containing protein, partial [Pseudomonadota bacterium]
MENTALVDNWLTSQLFEYAPTNISVVNPNLELVTANKNFIAVFGDFQNKTCYQVYKKCSSKCDKCSASRTFSDGKARTSSELGFDRIGSPLDYFVHHTPILDSSGSVAYVASMSYDISGRRDLQKQVDLLFDLAPCSVAIINKDFRIMHANRYVRAEFGDVVGTYCYQAYMRRNSPCSNCPAQKTLSDCQPHSTNQIRFSKDGSFCHFHVSTAALTTVGSENTHIVEMSLNVTQLHHLSEIAAIGRGVADLAHRMNNLLTGLRGAVYEIKIGFKKDAPHRTEKGIETLQKNLDRLTALATGCTKVSRAVTGDFAFVDPLEIAQEVFALFRQVALEANIDFVFDFDHDVQQAWLDP